MPRQNRARKDGVMGTPTFLLLGGDGERVICYAERFLLVTEGTLH
jgi:hypothetical protein